MADRICENGGRFSKCKEVAVNSCQYCGKNFCVTHKHYMEGIDAVCTKKLCVEKHEDLQRHEQYKAGVFQLNRAGLCGIRDCGPHPGSECSLCRGHFCGEHIRQRQYPFFNGYSTIERPASVCSHCWERRKLWRH